MTRGEICHFHSLGSPSSLVAGRAITLSNGRKSEVSVWLDGCGFQGGWVGGWVWAVWLVVVVVVVPETFTPVFYACVPRQRRRFCSGTGNGGGVMNIHAGVFFCGFGFIISLGMEVLMKKGLRGGYEDRQEDTQTHTRTRTPHHTTHTRTHTNTHTTHTHTHTYTRTHTHTLTHAHTHTHTRTHTQ